MHQTLPVTSISRDTAFHMVVHCPTHGLTMACGIGVALDALGDPMGYCRKCHPTWWPKSFEEILAEGRAILRQRERR